MLDIKYVREHLDEVALGAGSPAVFNAAQYSTAR